MLGTAGGSRDPRHESISALQKFTSAWESKACSRIVHKNRDIPWKTKSGWTTKESPSEQVADPDYGHCSYTAVNPDGNI